MWVYLVKNKLKSLAPEEAYRMQQEQGALVVDVRTEDKYEALSIEDAVSVPMFRYVQGSSLFDNIKKTVMLIGFAMKATERNPDFLKAAQERIPDKDSPIIVVCSIGGTLQTKVKHAHKPAINDPDRAFGRESRSLKAAHDLMRAGYTNVYHLAGGIEQWKFEGFPVA